MAANINPTTGIHYGVISARSLDQDVIDMIMDGDNVTEQAAEEEFRKQINHEIESGRLSADDFGEEMERRLRERSECASEDDYRYVEYDEAGKLQLEVQTIWLGSAMLVYVLQSPYLAAAPVCSPCCPNAGDLDNRYEDGEGGVTCYDVPPDWRIDEGALEATVEEVSNGDDEDELTAALEELEPYVCEVVLKGFDGGTDETDHKVLWVVTSMPCSKLEEWIRERGLEFEKVCATDVHTGDDAVDFDLPEEEHDFIATVKERSK